MKIPAIKPLDLPEWMQDAAMRAAREAMPQAIVDELERDLVLYGNSITHYANIDGRLVARRIDPREVFPEFNDSLMPEHKL